MKNVLFDLTATQPVGDIKRHGGGKYAEIIFLRIIERKLPVVCYFDGGKWLNPVIKELIDKCGIQLLDKRQMCIEEIQRLSGCNLIFSALPQHDLFNFYQCPVVGTVHGLRRLETPADTFSLLYKNQNIRSLVLFLYKKCFPRLYKRQLCRYKEKEWNNSMFSFVTVSNHSRCSMKVYFPFLRNKEIPVFYSPSTSNQRTITRKYEDKFFLLVSANRPDKNNLRAIMALDELFSNGYISDYHVVITGAKNERIFRYNIKNKDRFKFVGYVEDEELEQLMHDSYALIYPSLNEGFGYPPLEAMHYGVPVLASPYSSIPEICGNAAIYYNPFSIEEIATRILYVVDSDVRSLYSERSLSQFDIITAKQRQDLDSLIDYLYR